MFGNLFEKQKNEMIEKASGVISETFKNEIIQLLGEDARPEDVEVIKQYFEKGVAVKSAKRSLKEAGIL